MHVVKMIYKGAVIKTHVLNNLAQKPWVIKALCVGYAPHKLPDCEFKVEKIKK